MTIRLIGIDTPETRHPSQGVERFGTEATKRLKTMLPKGRTVYLEQDISDTDRYDRKLRYVWFEGYRDGKAYLVNELLVREGFAVVSTYPPDVADVEALTHAQDVATFREAGLWEECGGADTPLETTQQEPPTQAVVPTQVPVPTAVPLVTECVVFGSFEEANAYYAANPAAQPYLDPNVDGRACEVFFGVDQPAAPPPQEVPPSGGGCDPSYPAICIPPYPPDLNCPGIGYTDFTVYQPDPHGFDGDYDGVGCESGASTGSGNVSAPPPSTGEGGGPVYTEFGGLDGVDYDCYDFNSQGAAQAYFEADGGSVYNNADGLDRNHNGLAREPGEFD